MPKAYDSTRNYYADLELPTNASIDDIKKQYRKLAKTYHPDRNAGKEEECVPRFQAIQAAHEILSDPVNKAQYDADRRVAGPFKSTPTAGPAPRGNPYQASSNFPPPPRRTQPGQYQRPPRPQANGADRFSNFTGTQPPPKRPDPAQDRTNAFTAWQNMQNKARQQQQQKQRANAAQPTTSGPSTPSGQPPRPPPRADPIHPPEDKSRPGFRHYDTGSDEAEERRSAWEAWKRQGVPAPGIHRSNTTRTPKRQGFDPNTPGSDERPAASHYSHRHKSEDFGQPSARPEVPDPDNGASPTSPKVRRPHIDPTNPNRRKPSPEDVPFSEANRLRTPYTSFIGEKTDFSGNMRRSKSSRDTSKLNSPNSPLRPNSTSPLNGNSRKGNTFEFPLDSDVESPASSSSTEGPFTNAPNIPNDPADRPKKVPSPPSRRYNGAQSPFTAPGGEGTEETQARKEHIFNFGNGAAPFTPPPMPTGKSRSEENINTKFAQDFNGFSSNPDSAQSRPTSRKSTASFNRQNSRGRANPTFGQPSPLGTKFTSSDLPPPPTSAPHSATQTKAFSTEQWAQHFADGSWVVPPPPPGGPKGTSPLPQQSPIDPKARDSGFSAGDGDQMEIDEEPPSQAVNDRQTMPPPPKPHRKVPVPPSTWHQEQRAKHQAQGEQSSGVNIKTNLDDLSHVEPISRAGGAGLEDFSNLSADLPFKSQASQSSPFSPIEAQSSRIPSIPVAPQPPMGLTKSSWSHYSADFAIYFAAFHDFNGQFLLHFNTRQTSVMMKIQDGTRWLQASGDVASSNEAPRGFTAYARQIEQDVKLREIWNIGCDKHVVAVKQYEETREKIRRAVSGGGLADR